MPVLNDQSPRTLIDDLLAEQQQLTAVERFARKHDRGEVPAQARYYRDLIPIRKPGAGEQYAFAVDLDSCTGCKGCVSACHSLNGLDDDEIWRNVGSIHGGAMWTPYQQTVTTACHHCVEPGCLEGCPVMAYEKDAATGIVRHLDDQCIGCQYCVLKCPYDVPKYSERRGIVRKCDMCHSRLAADEAPACVQACPNSAISIRLVDKAEISAAMKPGDRMLPGAFDSSYTKPTTSYTSRKPIPPDAHGGDAHALRLEHAHWPLIWMLVLTQVAAGMFVGTSALAVMAPAAFAIGAAPVAAVGFILLNLGLAVSVLHLGRPLGAWRFFLGLGTSWMSREILAFSVFAGAAAAFAVVANGAWLMAQASSLLGAKFADLLNALVAMGAAALPSGWNPALLLSFATSALALAGLYCSAMIYVDTRRAFWRPELTFTTFFGTAFLLGSAGLAVVLGWTSIVTGADLGGAVRAAAIVAMFIRVTLFGWKFMNVHEALQNPTHPNHRPALVMWRLLRPLLLARIGLFIGSCGFGLAAIAGHGTSAAICATISFLLTFTSQTIERYIFFTAVEAPRMPGGVAA